MTIRQMIRGIVGAAFLALLCVCLSGWMHRGLEGRIVGQNWPYIETRRIWAICLPAMAFWFWYFAGHWRGRELGRECWSIARPALPLLSISALCAAFGWMAFGQTMLQRLYGYDHEGGMYAFGETNKAHVAGALLGVSVPLLVHFAYLTFRQKT